MSKIGRPKLKNIDYKLLKQIFPDIKTKRQLQNKYYESRVAGLIDILQDADFVRDKPCLLTEIGRFEDFFEIMSVAVWVSRRAKVEKKNIHGWAFEIKKLRKMVS